MKIRRPLLFAAAAIAAHAQLYVSPTDDDANPGTLARPVQTLPHARDLGRAQKINMVILLSGTYRLTEPLKLGPEDSGVTYKALNTAPPSVISGGIRIGGWKLADARRNLWSAGGTY